MSTSKFTIHGLVGATLPAPGGCLFFPATFTVGRITMRPQGIEVQTSYGALLQLNDFEAYYVSAAEIKRFVRMFVQAEVFGRPEFATNHDLQLGVVNLLGGEERADGRGWINFDSEAFYGYTNPTLHLALRDAFWRVAYEHFDGPDSAMNLARVAACWDRIFVERLPDELPQRNN